MKLKIQIETEEKSEVWKLDPGETVTYEDRFGKIFKIYYGDNEIKLVYLK